jgi:hypothetical protein
VMFHSYVKLPEGMFIWSMFKLIPGISNLEKLKT